MAARKSNRSNKSGNSRKPLAQTASKPAPAPAPPAAASAAPEAADRGVSMGALVSEDSLEFATGTRSSVFDPVFEVMETMKPGQALPIPVPEGVAPDIIQGRLTAAFSRRKVQETMAPEGYKFWKRTTKDGKQVVITLRPIGDGSGE